METLSLADIKRNLKTRLESEGLGPFHDRSLMSSLVEQFSGLFYLQQMRIEYLAKQLNIETAEGEFLDAFGKSIDIERGQNETDYSLLRRIRERLNNPSIGSINHYISMARSVVPDSFIHARFLHNQVDGIHESEGSMLCMFITTNNPEKPIYDLSEGQLIESRVKLKIEAQTPWDYNFVCCVHSIVPIDILVDLFPKDIPEDKVRLIMSLLRRTMLENYNPLGGYRKEVESQNRRVQILPKHALNKVLKREFGPEFGVNLVLGNLTERHEAFPTNELNPDNPDDDWTNRIDALIYPMLRHPIELENVEG